MKLVNVYQYDTTEQKLEHNSGELKTRPDESLSVLQLMVNHTKGIGFGLPAKQSAYNGSTFIPNLKTMDLVDQAEYLQNAKDEYDNKLATEAERQNAAEEARRAEQIQKEAAAAKLDV